MPGTSEKASSTMRTACLLLAAVILMPLLAAPAGSLAFRVQSDRIARMEHSSGELRKMVFTPGEFERLEFEREGREFCLGGVMYDIHSVIREEGRVIVLALRDQAESGLRKAAGASGHPAASSGSHHGLIFLPYFFSGTPDLGLSPDPDGERLVAARSLPCPEPVAPVAGPPPERPAEYWV